MINGVILKYLLSIFGMTSWIRRFICLFNPGFQIPSSVMTDKFPFYLYASIGSTETPPINALTFTQKHQGVCSGTSKCFKPDVFIRIYRWQADNKNGLIINIENKKKKFNDNDILEILLKNNSLNYIVIIDIDERIDITF